MQHRQTPTTTYTQPQQDSTQKLDKQKHVTRSQYTGVKQRDLHPHKHKSDRYLEGTHKKTWDHRRNTCTYWNTIHGLTHKRPPQQDNNSITFKNNTHINPKDIAGAFNKQFINTSPHKTNTTNRKSTQTTVNSYTHHNRASPSSNQKHQEQQLNRTRQHQHIVPQTHWQERTKVPHEHIQHCTQRQQDTSCMETGQHHTYPQT